MSSDSRVATYQRTRVLGAPPEDVHLMLYEGALRFCDQAGLALAANDRETGCNCLESARRIVLYLSACLRPEVAPELCALVASAYQFTYHRLVDASLLGGTEALAEAVGVLRGLRETWEQLLTQHPRHPNATAEPRTAERGIHVTG